MCITTGASSCCVSTVTGRSRMRPAAISPDSHSPTLPSMRGALCSMSLRTDGSKGRAMISAYMAGMTRGF
ncbi:Uncharacterised protein [Mycobacteroides abscessus subsp. abscessus]|nr:Uncharacterised protein [Mycobacteroides abscessus subsp. abscessus]